MPQPFRFAVYGAGNSRAAWGDYARKVESLGYSTLVVADHIAWGGLAPLPALLAAADVTTTLRLGTHVLVNDFRHPAVLAHEAATIDLLSDGRLELGLGAGWLRGDYELTGVPFDSPGVRLARLIEAVALIRRLFHEDSVTYAGEHYRVHELSLDPKPVQRPHPPLYIRAARKRMLTFAAQEANIVGVATKATSGRMLDLATITADAVAEKVGWVREAAGMRFSDLELHLQLISVVVTDDRQRGAEMAAKQLAGYSSIAINTNLSTEQILESLHVLVGSVNQMVETLQLRRERYGISYFTLFGDINAFAPVVARLAGR